MGVVSTGVFRGKSTSNESALRFSRPGYATLVHTKIANCGCTIVPSKLVYHVPHDYSITTINHKLFLVFSTNFRVPLNGCAGAGPRRS